MNMDLSSILPLLMNKNKTSDASTDKSSGADTNNGANSDTMATLLSAVASGKPLDKTEMLTKLMPSSGKGSNIAQMMSIANSMNNQNKQAPTPPPGLAPINNLASSDILGRLVKVMQNNNNKNNNNKSNYNNNNNNSHNNNKK